MKVMGANINIDGVINTALGFFLGMYALQKAREKFEFFRVSAPSSGSTATRSVSKSALRAAYRKGQASATTSARTKDEPSIAERQ